MSYKSFVINLDRHKDRLDDFYKTIDMKVERFSAINKNSDPSLLSRLQEYFSPINALTKNEIYCAMSHLFLWEQLVKSDFDKFIIFEDDARSYGKVQERVDSIIDADYDILFLGKCLDHCSKLKMTRYENIFRSYRPLCTHAYIITRKFAKKLLSEKVSNPIDRHINSVYGKFLAYHPSLVYQETIKVSSTIASSIDARLHISDCSFMDTDIVTEKVKTNSFFLWLIVIIILFILILILVKGYFHLRKNGNECS